MNRRACILVAATALAPAGTMLAPAPAAAQVIESRPIAGAFGAMAGTIGGGYLTLSVIVLEARMGRYLHDPEDLLGWRSAPILIGTLAGTSLGIWSPRRLEGAVVFGAAGMGVGAAIGMGIGSLVWDPPEGRWAGAAIGAGAGLIAGNIYGVLNPLSARKDGGTADTESAPGIPVVVRIRF